MRLRIALTISGAVALGAYEGGALAALLCAIRDLCRGDDPTVRIDAIGGASAGSLTGLLAARCLLEGIDPVHVMREAWVERDSLPVMRTHTPDEPLSLDALRGASVDLVDRRAPFGRPAHRVGARQGAPIRMVMALASLRGLEYRVPSLSARQPVRATTSLDWATFTFTSGQPVRELTEPRRAAPTDVAVASAANALAVRPVVVARKGDEGGYRARRSARDRDLPAVEAALVHGRRNPRQRAADAHARPRPGGRPGLVAGHAADPGARPPQPDRRADRDGVGRPAEPAHVARDTAASTRHAAYPVGVRRSAASRAAQHPARLDRPALRRDRAGARRPRFRECESSP